MAAVATTTTVHRAAALVSRRTRRPRLGLHTNGARASLKPAASTLTRPRGLIRPYSALSAKEEAPLASLLSTHGKGKFISMPSVDLPDEIPLKPGQRLVAIGDVHGDLDQLRKALRIAGVLADDGDTWIGGDTICVQTGDVLDRGDSELGCYRLLTDLARRAHDAGQGGAVALLFGNHETINVEGLFHYAWPQGNAEFESEVGGALDGALGTRNWRIQFAGNQPARWAALEPGGLLAEPLLGSMKVAVKVGRTVLVHGGLSMPHLDYYGGGIQGMNQTARDWIRDAQHGSNNNLGRYESVEAVLRAAQSRADAISRSMPKCLGGNAGESSPVWLRLYSSPPDLPPQNPIAQSQIDSVLSELGADRMVVGHTPQKRINSALQGKVWRIDVGASKGMKNGKVEVLEVICREDNRDGAAAEEVWILTESKRIPASERQTAYLGS